MKLNQKRSSLGQNRQKVENRIFLPMASGYTNLQLSLALRACARRQAQQLSK